jgi:hypothetical protein
MNGLTLSMQQSLEVYCENGGKVYYVAYDPTIVGTKGGTSTPEADAIAKGYKEWYREDTPNLVEVIYRG